MNPYIPQALLHARVHELRRAAAPRWGLLTRLLALVSNLSRQGHQADRAPSPPSCLSSPDHGGAAA